ncbi:MAG: hypothetical protein FJY83_06870 [Candidatus Aminicenantes bacterium]|nr:hypothetical protein [Candidatus Aminicenantes bacterium]
MKTKNTSFAGAAALLALVLIVLPAGADTVAGSLFKAADRPVLDAETAGLSASVDASSPGFTYQVKPVFKPAPRFQFESAAFTGTLFSLAALNVADYLSTREALKYPGVAEGNPFMSLVVNNSWAFAAVKLATTAYFYYGLKKMHGRNKTTAWVMTLAANALYSFVIYNNLTVIDKMRNR